MLGHISIKDNWKKEQNPNMGINTYKKEPGKNPVKDNFIQLVIITLALDESPSKLWPSVKHAIKWENIQQSKPDEK